MLRLALYEPEIPHNTGTLMRLCACFGVPLDLIEPLGFVLTDKHLKRAGMDYRDLATVKTYPTSQAFWQSRTDHLQGRVILLDTKGQTPYTDFEFLETDTILMGKESTGVPNHIFECCDAVLKIPMKPDCRSINLALAAAMVLGEALRQTGFDAVLKPGAEKN
jgi:tRNA (cytidine/uridine-2'-O-)-methyltransferase